MNFVRSVHGRSFVRKRQKLEQFELSTLLEAARTTRNDDSDTKKGNCRRISHRKNEEAEALEYMTRSYKW